ncbi:hypothetical protein BSPWISOXPB_2053 [uncultured Gammaproteobacteria bacterium]|nr:hypothetical protein BSPWISOXPB_2053 [uncultured Gammaproteobacteria bacterium]
MFFGLAREAKILKSSEYTHVFKGGTLARGKHWQVIAKPLKASNHAWVWPYQKKSIAWRLTEIDLNALPEKHLDYSNNI